MKKWSNGRLLCFLYLEFLTFIHPTSASFTHVVLLSHLNSSFIRFLLCTKLDSLRKKPSIWLFTDLFSSNKLERWSVRPVGSIDWSDPNNYDGNQSFWLLRTVRLQSWFFFNWIELLLPLVQGFSGQRGKIFVLLYKKNQWFKQPSTMELLNYKCC